MEFKITKNLTAECETYQTRYSWGHKAWLYRDGQEIGYRKKIYYNRTWESYEFESILENLLADARGLTKYETLAFKKAIKNGGKHDCDSLKVIANIAKLGDLFGTTPTEKNDFKTRILKAGLENKGLIIPEDWDSLDEETKEARLNGAIGALA